MVCMSLRARHCFAHPRYVFRLRAGGPHLGRPGLRKVWDRMTAPSAPPVPSSALPSANPFERFAEMLDGVEPGADPVIMTIGEPRHAPPTFVGDILQDTLADFRRYPNIRGTDDLRAAIGDWLDKRYGLCGSIDRERGILPLNGSREGLSFAVLGARDYLVEKSDRPAVLMPNPFYQTYAAAAHIAGAEAIYLDAGPETCFLPDLTRVPPETLDRTIAVFYASPANPQGAVARMQDWTDMIDLARRHDFFVFADECYSEIYRDMPPPGLLEAAHRADAGYERIVTINSLSKRSNLAGLRCGFAAGDAAFLSQWARFRGLAAPQVPMPLQAVAAAAFRDEGHVVENRRLYNEKFAVAEAVLSPLFDDVTPEGGFFLWLDVGRWGGGRAVATRLWRDVGVKVLPGEVLAADVGDHNPGRPYIRLALVDEPLVIETALTRICSVLGGS